MALMIPERLDAGTPDSERRVADALRGLTDGWRVMHSVAWQGLKDGRLYDGEADFVIIHPDHGLIVLEVKGGGIEVHNGRWHSTDRHGRQHEIKNPFVQATGSKHAIHRYLKSRDQSLPFLPSAHAVVFPDVSDPGSLGPAAPADLALGRAALGQLEDKLGSLLPQLPSAQRLTKNHIARVVELLAPTVRVKPLLREAVEDIRAEQMTLTAEQTQVLDRLRRNLRAAIYGSAGTGKTVLAAEKARRLGSEGFRVLLTCFNRPLGEHLAAVTADTPNVTAMSFHAFVGHEARRAGIRLPTLSGQAWDDAAAEALTQAAEVNDTRIDALVIDEAQDFPSSWFTALQLLLSEPDRGPFYLFADAQQAIYRTDWTAPFSEPSFDLSVNCRNTQQIATRVSGVFQTDEQTLGVAGPEPEHVPANSPDETYEAVRKALHRLVREEGLRPDQVVVLSTMKSHVAALSGKTVAGLRLGQLGEVGCEVVVETVHRFKGLEADAVILALPELSTDQDRALAYIGLSRPRSVLVVVGPDNVWDRLTS
jgi:hypothetical protein